MGKLSPFQNFKSHIDSLKKKLRWANCLHSKMRHYLSKNLLRTIYFALFDSHLWYGSQILRQCQTQSLQNKALQILNFRGHCEISQPLYKISKTFKLKDFGYMTCSLCRTISVISFQRFFKTILLKQLTCMSMILKKLD